MTADDKDAFLFMAILAVCSVVGVGAGIVVVACIVKYLFL